MTRLWLIKAFCLLIVLVQDSAYSQQNYGSVLRYTAKMLESKHYIRFAIDDNFSQLLFTNYLDRLDPDRLIFRPTDIIALQPFATTLDDELRGELPVRFVPAVYTVYKQRIGYLQQHFSTDSAWQQRLLDQQVARLSLLMDEQEKDNARSTTVLQDSARQMVYRKTTARLTRLLENFTMDKQFDLYTNCVATLSDPHTEYFSPAVQQAFMDQMGRKTSSIGAWLGMQGDDIIIVGLAEDGPALKSGQIQKGDVISGIAEGAGPELDVNGYNVNEISQLLWGHQGSTITLKLRKVDGRVVGVTLVRDIVAPEEQLARSVVIQQKKKRIGYLQLPAFYFSAKRTCSDDVLQELEKLKAQRIDALVFDVRNNGGGSLPDVSKIIGYFIESGPTVQVLDRGGRYQLWEDEDKGTIWNGPMVVLINGLSASASELFAAAMQDYKRAIIAGSNSFGKGTVQVVLPLGADYAEQSTLGALKITTDKFYRVGGNTTQQEGVLPDVIIPIRYSDDLPQEKKMPHALSADAIAPVVFTSWANKYDRKALIQSAQQGINNDKRFQQVTHLSEQLKEFLDTAKKNHPVDVLTYRQQQATIKQLNSGLDKLQKLDKPMRVKSIDNAVNGADKRNEKWLRSISEDATLQAAVHIVAGML